LYTAYLIAQIVLEGHSPIASRDVMKLVKIRVRRLQISPTNSFKCEFKCKCHFNSLKTSKRQFHCT